MEAQKGKKKKVRKKAREREVQRSQLVSQHVVETSRAKETEKRERRGGTSRVGLPPHLLSLPTDVDKILHGPCERDTEEPFLATNSNNGDAWSLSSVAFLRGSSSSTTTIEEEVECEKTTKLPNTLFNRQKTFDEFFQNHPFYDTMGKSIQ